MRAVSQADAQADRPGPAVFIQHPDAPAGDGAAAAGARRRHFLVTLALLGAQHLGDAGARFGAQPLGLPAPLALVRGVERADAVAGLVQYRLDFRLLRGIELQLLRQALARRFARLLAAFPLFRRSFRAGRRGDVARLRHARGTKAQRGVRHLQHVLARIHHDAHVGGHAGKQFQVRVGRRNDRGVGDDVLHHQRGLAHLPHRAAEDAAGKGIHGKRRGLPLADAPDLGLVDRGVDLHPAQVLRDHEEFRRLQARRDRLARLHRFLDDDAVHRRADGGALEVDPRLRELGLALPHQRLDVVHLGLTHRELGLRDLDLLLGCPVGELGLVQRRRRHEVLLVQHPVALELALGIGQVDSRARDLGVQRGDVGALGEHRGARRLHVRQRLAHAQRERVRVDAGDDLPFPDRRVEVGEDFLELPGDLRADLHHGHRVHRAGGRDRRRDRAALDLRQPVGGRGGVRAPPGVDAGAGGEDGGHDGRDDDVFA